METSLTSALIIRRSPGVAVCRPEKNTRMWLWNKVAEAHTVDERWQVRGRSLALLVNWNNHKLTFLVSPSHTKRQVFFALSAPSSFFLLLSAAHNSEHYGYGCSQTLEWISNGTGLYPPSAHYVEHCTGLNCLTVAELKIPSPFPFSNRKLGDSGFFPLLCLSWLPSFIFCLPLSFVTEVPLWRNTTLFGEHYSNNPSQVGVQPVEQCTHFQRQRLILALLRWPAHLHRGV